MRSEPGSGIIARVTAMTRPPKKYDGTMDKWIRDDPTPEPMAGKTVIPNIPDSLVKAFMQEAVWSRCTAQTIKSLMAKAVKEQIEKAFTIKVQTNMNVPHNSSSQFFCSLLPIVINDALLVYITDA